MIMIQNILSGFMKVRFALWAMDRVLPKGSDLKLRFRSGLMGIMAAVAAGVLAACLFGAVIVAIGYSLFYYGNYSELQAIIVAAALSLICIMLLLIYGRAKINKAISGFDGNPEHKKKDVKSEDKNAIDAIINGFLDGLLSNSPPSKTKSFIGL